MMHGTKEEISKQWQPIHHTRNTAIRSDKISVLFLARPITRTCVYIKVPYFTSFRFPASSIVVLGLGLVVGLGTMLVLFFLLHFFLFDVC